MQLVQAARDADTDCSQASCSAANSLIGTASAASASVTKTHLTRAQAAPRQFAVARSDFALGDGTRACRARPCHATTLRGAHVATPASAALSGPMTANRSCCCAALRCAKPYGGGSILHGGGSMLFNHPDLEHPRPQRSPGTAAPRSTPTKVRMPDAAGSDRQGAARPCPRFRPGSEIEHLFAFAPVLLRLARERNRRGLSNDVNGTLEPYSTWCRQHHHHPQTDHASRALVLERSGLGRVDIRRRGLVQFGDAGPNETATTSILQQPSRTTRSAARLAARIGGAQGTSHKASIIGQTACWAGCCHQRSSAHQPAKVEDAQSRRCGVRPSRAACAAPRPPAMSRFWRTWRHTPSPNLAAGPTPSRCPDGWNRRAGPRLGTASPPDEPICWSADKCDDVLAPAVPNRETPSSLADVQPALVEHTGRDQGERGFANPYMGCRQHIGRTAPEPGL
ncbi:hypothetical protein ACCO45_007285 [Purpureocillium lilacinum]|uniref:Uncharacterized protein n=1 Tax=Purpureocillium lilacinum TaxID=33203 RepID=A0ACC4DUZ5_PURLI